MRVTHILISLGLLSMATAVAAPANDMFQNAQVLEGTYIETKANLSQATGQVSEPTQQKDSFQRTVWYSWVAPRQGDVRLEGLITNGRYFGIAAYIGDLWPNLYLINSASGWSGTTGFSFPVAAGQRVWIQLGESTATDSITDITWSLNCTTSGILTPELNVSTVASPANDAFANPVFLEGAFVTAVAYNSSAGTGATDPTTAGYKNFWYSWTSPTTGVAAIDLQPYSYSPDLALGVFTGDQIESITTVVAKTALYADSLSLSFDATQGQRYMISIGQAAITSTSSLIMTIRAAKELNANLAAVRAICLKVPTVQGKRYQLQSTVNFETWINVNASFVGDGTTVNQFVDTAAIDRSHYRLMVSPL